MQSDVSLIEIIRLYNTPMSDGVVGGFRVCGALSADSFSYPLGDMNAEANPCTRSFFPSPRTQSHFPHLSHTQSSAIPHT